MIATYLTQTHPRGIGASLRVSGSTQRIAASLVMMAGRRTQCAPWQEEDAADGNGRLLSAALYLHRAAAAVEISHAGGARNTSRAETTAAAVLTAAASAAAQACSNAAGEIPASGGLRQRRDPRGDTIEPLPPAREKFSRPLSLSHQCVAFWRSRFQAQEETKRRNFSDRVGLSPKSTHAQKISWHANKSGNFRIFPGNNGQLQFMHLPALLGFGLNTLKNIIERPVLRDVGLFPDSQDLFTRTRNSRLSSW